MRYLLLGKSGFIAESFLQEFHSRSTQYIALSRREVDYTNTEVLKKYLDLNWVQFVKGCTIINCAGYIGRPNVDACENHKSETIGGNIIFPTLLSEICSSRGIPLIHISSGCIYSGNNKGRGFSESDAPNFSFLQNNCSFYSGCKALGEDFLQNNSSCYILRLRVPFDNLDNPRNYLSKCLSYSTLLNVENSLTNRLEFPSYALNLVEQKAPYGIYNICNSGSLWTKEIVDLIKIHLDPNKEFKFFTNEEEFTKVAKAPRSSCTMDTSKVEKYIEIKPVRQSIEEALKTWSP